jgi:hypothetical protein
MAFVKQALGPVMTPKAVHFYDAIPRTPVGVAPFVMSTRNSSPEV